MMPANNENNTASSNTTAYNAKDNGKQTSNGLSGPIYADEPIPGLSCDEQTGLILEIDRLSREAYGDGLDLEIVEENGLLRLASVRNDGLN
ncbi:hypothetical protein CC1G_06507 [Coprinopsis cinerea okayama7|jgi:hypothetical protein|uniref:Uncharacterized protein n=1 Tax=Coprinopsis cinerea (strain Okayama-7 / 130 / ATCC MYA-4618 / FGSC 9003) TaxID=240176 RepID=A8NND1_COPC7|nr:hypothetical protein CC1G_06507 [Coprinopsis cinerea okayama7\|eukprot:XP_001835104.2 hypothetical protein CC1G_06507 [Coprinopsis cinerea okayama7\